MQWNDVRNGDMTWCVGNDCPKKAECHRYLGQPIGGQHVWVFYPHEEGVECEYFMPSASQ